MLSLDEQKALVAGYITNLERNLLQSLLDLSANKRVEPAHHHGGKPSKYDEMQQNHDYLILALQDVRRDFAHLLDGEPEAALVASFEADSRCC